MDRRTHGSGNVYSCEGIRDKKSNVGVEGTCFMTLCLEFVLAGKGHQREKDDSLQNQKPVVGLFTLVQMDDPPLRSKPVCGRVLRIDDQLKDHQV